MPSEYFITFALWPTVTFRLRFARTYSNAKRTIRLAPETLMGFRVIPASSGISKPPSSWSFVRRAVASGVPRSNSIPR